MSKITVTQGADNKVNITVPASQSITVTQKGQQGDAASIEVGTVTTGAEGSSVTVVNSGTTKAAVLDFSIPVGNTGATGPGVASGGTSGQALLKVDGTDYNTQWSDLSVSSLTDSATVVLTTGNQTIDGNKTFSGIPIFSNGAFSTGQISITTGDLYISTGGVNAGVGASTFNSATFSGDLRAPSIQFLGNGTSIIEPSNIGGVQEDLEIRSNGNITVKLDYDNNELNQKFIVSDNAGVEKFSVNENGSATINNAYTLPTSDGTTGQLLQTDGAGTVSFVSFSGSPWTTTGSDIYYNTGNVGIGTTTPAQPLHVNGTIRTVGIGNGYSTDIVTHSNGGLTIGENISGVQSQSVNIGRSMGRFNAGTQGVLIGKNAGYRGTYSHHQVAIGTSSNSGGAAYSKSAAIGIGANSNYNGSDNTTSVGASTGNNSPSSYTNSAFFGYAAGHSGGNNSVFVGYEAGKSDGVQLVSDTVAVGYQALTALTTGAGNTAVGYQAGAALTTSSNNTVIGYQAGSLATGSDNTLLGYLAGEDLTSGNNNTALGAYALKNITTGGGNTSIGWGSGGNWSTTSSNVAVGMYAANANTGSNNVALGHESQRYNRGSDNISIGKNALFGTHPQSANNNVAIGTNTLRAVGTGADNNVGVGYRSLAVTTGSNTVAIGYEALTALTTGTSNTAVGYQAGAALTAAGSNTFFGYQAGYQSSSAFSTDNTFIGNGAGSLLTTNAYAGIVAVGSGAGNNPNTRSVHVGYNSGFNNNGFGTVNIGFGAGGYGTSDNSVTIGYQANYASGTTNKVGIGYGANAGANSVAIGYQAGESTGSGNIFIGYQAGDGETGSNKLFIENSNSTTPLIYGEFDNDILRVNGTLQVNDPASTGYAFPTATGTLGQVLEVDANGDLAFATPSGGGGGGDVVNDTTPQLGGDLDVNSNKITSTSAGEILIEPDTSGVTRIANPNGNTTVVKLGGNTNSGGSIHLDFKHHTTANNAGASIRSSGGSYGTGSLSFYAKGTNTSDGASLTSDNLIAKMSYTDGLEVYKNFSVLGGDLQFGHVGGNTLAQKRIGVRNNEPSSTQSTLHVEAGVATYQNRAGGSLVLKTGAGAGTGNSGSIQFWTCEGIAASGTTNTNLERMRLTPEGYLGVGITSPTNTLHVDGTAKVDGSAEIQLDSSASETFTVHDGTHDLFQVDTGTTGVLFSVNDVSGLPKLEVDEDQGVIAKSVKADDGALTAAGQYGKGAEIWYQGTGATQAGSACYLNSSGDWTKTNATNNTNSVGMLAIAAGSDSDVNGMVTRGFVYVSADPGGSVGDVVYLSAATDGLLTTTAPTGTTGFVVRVVGHKVGTNIIYFNPSNDFITLA